MTRYVNLLGCAATFLAAGGIAAQAPGITMEMIRTSLPLEGAPLAIHGPYDVTSEPAFGSPRHVVYRPADLGAFPVEDSLPVLIWGNGGCAMNSDGYRGWLTTIASHGFVAIATAVIEGEETRRANPDDLRPALDWIESENARADSPLLGKIATDAVAVMGTSCGGFMAIDLGSDPRVDTIGVFNSGVQDADREDRSPTAPAPAALAGIHGPVLLVNGHERDFMMDESQATFDGLDRVPVFYGARHDAGHSATVFHPGGGEFANVAAAWLRFVLKGEAEAGRMFVGPACELCTNDNWDTDSKGLTLPGAFGPPNRPDPLR
jgi:dienelactone hydrolase